MKDLFFDSNGNLTKQGSRFLIKFAFAMALSLPIMWFKFLFTKKY